MLRHRTCLLAVTMLSILVTAASAQRLDVPRRHDRPPGPPLSPEEAVAKMTVPDGFSVEIVAAEPDVVNPVAMCIDEKGRFWVTESFEYPRREPGPGRDRVKVLEDTDGDGKVDKVTVFADGLNIPSGIAVGYGGPPGGSVPAAASNGADTADGSNLPGGTNHPIGVWVANAPDILFLQDTDGDLKADKVEKVVTGFGRLDTHELPNSLTWGPDGWLYGLNGVFNNSHVKYTPENPNYEADHPGWPLTCAMFRIHPRTREFDVFAEGTSNPWGIAFNNEGDAFISACVIDHLWHIVETGYYIRQGGPYPPHTWPMRSIVDHKHQKAAYCGIEWFDSDAYPEEYRNVLYMGNIHGGCINADILERSGSTYKGKPHPGFPPKPGAWDDDEYDVIRKRGDGDDAKLADFLTANDPWFMPVVQKTGPDGCLYILDWYDRYHCYQDANADPEGVDRGKGRLYRVRYKDTPHAQPFDMEEESDDELIERLSDPNVYYRRTAQRLLSERRNEKTATRLEQIVRDSDAQIRTRLHALWALAGFGPLDDRLLQHLIERETNPLQWWGVRLAGNKANVGVPVEGALQIAAIEGDPVTRLQASIAFPKLTTSARHTKQIGKMRANTVHGTCLGETDPVAVQIAWQNLKPLIHSHPADVVEVLSSFAEHGYGHRGELVARTLEVLVDSADRSGRHVRTLLEAVVAEPAVAASVRRRCLDVLADRARQRALSGEQLREVVETVRAAEKTILGEPEVVAAGTALLALGGDAAAQQRLRTTFVDTTAGDAARLSALQTLIAGGDGRVADSVRQMLFDTSTRRELRGRVIEALAGVNDPAVGRLLLENLDELEPEIRPKALEMMTQRPTWSVALLKAIQSGQIDKDALNFNQLKRLALFKNDELQALLAETYGAIRQDRRSDRQHVINFHRDFLRGTPGDPERGQAAFQKVCGQCHKIYGAGAEVGPDITRNGRNNWDQLLQNVFDPSAVIGPGYQARTLVTLDGRVLTGLPVEESDQRVVLKIQGGKTETIPRDQIEAYAVSEMSMMPEDLEKQLTPQEIADLFAFLALDKPPSDPSGKLLPGAPQPKSR